MLRWLGPRKIRGSSAVQQQDVTDDPLAAIQPETETKQIYSVSRSVYLPRVALRISGDVGGSIPIPSEGGINPLYSEENFAPPPPKTCAPAKIIRNSSRQSTPPSTGKSTSSGYGGSHGDSIPEANVKLRDDAVSILEQNGNYVKSIKVAAHDTHKKKISKVASTFLSPGSSAAGTLTTIPEGRIDFTIPRPIWPKLDRSRSGCDSKKLEVYDSLVDEEVLLYTSPKYNIDNNNKPSNGEHIEEQEGQTLKDVLIELLNNINETMEGNKGTSAEEMLKYVNAKIALSVEALKNATEEEMRKFCVNLSSSKNINSVIRAFSNCSTSGNSSQSSARLRTLSSETEDIYQIPSGSSSSGFSDSVKHVADVVGQLPVFVHEDLSSVPNGVRNAMIYGTLCRVNLKAGGNEKLVENKDKCAVQPKKSLLRAANDCKPSVWEQYYGVNAIPKGMTVEDNYIPKPTDVPIFPGGRPEADFTLDVPRSELLSKRMKADKKWRCRCRLLTSFLGLVFFLLSVMAVSLMLTRGKRMFGSMV